MSPKLVAGWTLEPNPRHVGWRCLRCGRRQPRADFAEGCPACAAEGHAANLAGVYDTAGLAPDASAPSGLYRWGDALPYRRGVSLGEGGTPIVPLPRLAARFGLEALLLKNESANPTGSHKDRMAALALTRALDVGAARVVLASSGNAGVAAACYAAAAGLPCDVAVYRSLGAASRRLLDAAGARVHAFASGPERWRFVERQVREHGAFALTNFVVPAVGSPPFGVEAYRSIAFELGEQCPEPPQHVVVPTARGDLLWGLASGFLALREAGRIGTVPRLWAVEPFARLSRVIEGVDYRASFDGRTEQASIAGHTVTWQAVQALRVTGGGAVEVRDDDAWHAWRALGQDGWVGELCAAAAVAAVGRLMRRDAIAPGARVAVVFTARADRDTAVAPPRTDVSHWSDS